MLKLAQAKKTSPKMEGRVGAERIEGESKGGAGGEPFLSLGALP